VSFVSEGPASVNYRLSPNTTNSEFLQSSRIKYPIHEIDVVNAIVWIRNHATEFGGNPNKIILVAHSAGRGITGLISIDEQFLNSVSISLNNITCSISLDSDNYDHITKLNNPNTTSFQKNIIYNGFAISSENDVNDFWNLSSSIKYIAGSSYVPNYFIVARDDDVDRLARNQNFSDIINAEGFNSQMLITSGLTHEEINVLTGDPTDTVITPSLVGFLNNCK